MPRVFDNQKNRAARSSGSMPRAIVCRGIFVFGRSFGHTFRRRARSASGEYYGGSAAIPRATPQ